MGILECKYICNPKEIEEKMDIINYNYSKENNNEIKSDTYYNKDLEDPSYSRKITLDENYISFKKFFEEKLPLIGNYFLNIPYKFSFLLNQQNIKSELLFLIWML